MERPASGMPEELIPQERPASGMLSQRMLHACPRKAYLKRAFPWQKSPCAFCGQCVKHVQGKHPLGIPNNERNDLGKLTWNMPNENMPKANFPEMVFMYVLLWLTCRYCSLLSNSKCAWVIFSKHFHKDMQTWKKVGERVREVRNLFRSHAHGIQNF